MVKKFAIITEQYQKQTPQGKEIFKPNKIAAAIP